MISVEGVKEITMKKYVAIGLGCLALSLMGSANQAQAGLRVFVNLGQPSYYCPPPRPVYYYPPPVYCPPRVVVYHRPYYQHYRPAPRVIYQTHPYYYDQRYYPVHRQQRYRHDRFR